MYTQSSAVFKSEELPVQSIIIPYNRPLWYVTCDEPVIHHWICSRKFVDECVSGLQVATARLLGEEALGGRGEDRART
jgi:hypothetical protein